MDAIDRLRMHLPYAGEAPFGSCFQQGIANVLGAMGLADAEQALGASWAISWHGGSRIGSDGGWIENVEAICGVRVRRISSSSWELARATELELLAARRPPVVGVDSFGIPSPHQGRTHLIHAVIAVDGDDRGVTVCDPMNNPDPTRIGLGPYAELRGATCVDRYEMLVCEGEVRNQLDPLAAVRTLTLDAVRSRDDDETALAGFSAWIAENGATGLDVADVGAERLYAAKLLSAAAVADDRFASHAKALGSLARRWYLLHTLALESDEAGRPLAADRATRLLEDLGRREVEARAALLSALESELYEECLG